MSKTKRFYEDIEEKNKVDDIDYNLKADLEKAAKDFEALCYELIENEDFEYKVINDEI